ncbi:Oligopeptide transporter 8 [Zancudomyces culisetae]|uniref:Oligopeptide transporter 8 n=1 Tax=Zancudomyces culisetae TaxID=1213189 RepID=A0A1R1PIZ3_ZANCU|nr:Oligopeptide transporter 8 [Zancudomyces culisetae]|eukprot:OMH80954.1 Oligopeptide transporter 8 [Zancudomyces culisetae]
MFKRLISRGSTSKEDDEKTVNEADKEHLDEKTENASQGYDTNIEEEEEDSPYEVVRANVSPKDDVDACVLTFRVWSIGTTFSMLLSFINQFFFFRQTPIRIGFPVIMLITFLAGKLMEKMIPAKTIRPFGMERYSFSLNPGPFSVKEHGLLCVFVGTGSAIAYAIDVMVLQELYYNIRISYIEVIMFLISTQLLGYGLSGLLYNVLVKPAVMIWPDNLVSCSVLRALHGSNENDTRNGKKLMSKYNFFSLVLIGTFLYQLLPGFFFQLLASISILCFLYPNSIKAQQLGSGMTGLGLGSFTFDWTVIASYLGSPLATPYWAAVNIFVGFVFFCWM